MNYYFKLKFYFYIVGSILAIKTLKKNLLVGMFEEKKPRSYSAFASIVFTVYVVYALWSGFPSLTYVSTYVLLRKRKGIFHQTFTN